MKAVVVTPGQANSARVADVPDPVPAAGEAVVDVIEVGVCGTDNEIVRPQLALEPFDVDDCWQVRHGRGTLSGSR